MQERDSDAADSALLIYLACVRKLLRRFGGYECQEADGSFMLAFKNPTDAILFCLMVKPLKAWSMTPRLSSKFQRSVHQS